MEIPKDLKNEIWDYCRANNITNIDEFTLKCLRQGFSVEKFGATPITRVVEKEVEKIVEVPVEKIVEKIVEVPIEKTLEKIVYVTNDEETKKLSNNLNDCKAANLAMQTQITINGENHNKEIEKLKSELEVTKKLLIQEQNKNKKDIYGES